MASRRGARLATWAMVAPFAAMLIFGLGASAAGAKAPAGVACGDTITVDTTLTTNLNCSDSGLTIAASDVTLDLGGHTIRGSGGVGVGISIGSSNVVVRDGRIRGFQRGLVSGADAHLAGVTITDNDTGVNVNSFGGRLTVEDSRIVRNSGDGIAAVPGHLAVSNSTIKNNGGAGAVTGQGGEFVNNDVSSNGGTGLATHNGTSRFEGNRVNGNGGDGIYMQLSVAIIRGNEASGNAGNGIFIEESAPQLLPGYRIGDNTVNRNGNLGFGFLIHYPFPFAETVVDEGDNHARHNGNPAQCDVPGLTCTPR